MQGGLPSWLQSPDVGAAPPWLNTLTLQLWPYIQRAASKWTMEDRRLEVLLNSTTFWRPGWLARSGVRVAGVNLGDVPPRVTAVKVYRPEVQRGTALDQVTLESEFVFDSKMEGEWPAAACMQAAPDQALRRQPWKRAPAACSATLHDGAARGAAAGEAPLPGQHRQGVLRMDLHALLHDGCSLPAHLLVCQTTSGSAAQIRVSELVAKGTLRATVRGGGCRGRHNK